MKTVDANALGLERNSKIVYIIDSRIGLLGSRKLKNIGLKLEARGYCMSYPSSSIAENDEVFRYFFPWIAISDKSSVPSLLRSRICDVLGIPAREEIKIAIHYDDFSESFQWVEIGEKEWLDSIAPKEFSVTGLCEEHRLSMCAEMPPVGRAPATKDVEYVFNERMDTLEREAKRILSGMISRGYNCQQLKLWMDSFIKPSRLRITPQYRIYLTDYGNIEVKMRPLPKAVFIFFLKPPEGCMLSDLQDYRDELRSIYGKVCRVVDFSKINHSIDLLVDPFNNSICEKCSAIKSAFIKVVAPEVAAYYYVSGAQGEPKGIRLDRKLVVWE